MPVRPPRPSVVAKGTGRVVGVRCPAAGRGGPVRPDPFGLVGLISMTSTRPHPSQVPWATLATHKKARAVKSRIRREAGAMSEHTQFVGSMCVPRRSRWRRRSARRRRMRAGWPPMRGPCGSGRRDRPAEARCWGGRYGSATRSRARHRSSAGDRPPEASHATLSSAGRQQSRFSGHTPGSHGRQGGCRRSSCVAKNCSARLHPMGGGAWNSTSARMAEVTT